MGSNQSVIKPAKLTGIDMSELDMLAARINRQIEQCTKDKQRLRNEYKHHTSDTNLHSCSFNIGVEYSDPNELARVLNSRYSGTAFIKPDISREEKEWSGDPDGSKTYIDENHIIKCSINSS